MGRNDDGWHLDEGELLAPGLSALRRLGGGAAYEAWLCFDEVTWSPVVVKALRPSQLEDESSRRGLRREVLALATVACRSSRTSRSPSTSLRPCTTSATSGGPTSTSSPAT